MLLGFIGPKDIIATVALMVLVLLKVYQGEGNIDALVTMVIGYYFAKRQGGTDNGI